MPVCSRCNQDSGFLGLLSFNKQKGRCGKCEKEVGQTLAHFRQDFLNASSSKLLTEEDWQRLSNNVTHNHIAINEALEFIRGDALHFLERALTFFNADGVITNDEERYIRTLLRIFNLTEFHSGQLLDRLVYLKSLSEIRRGNLPFVSPSFHLESDETCHLNMGATYHKINAKSVTYMQGRLVATNKKLLFLSPSGGVEIQWKRIMRVEREGQGVYIELSTQKGNGYYDVTDSMYAEAVLQTIVRMAKREMVAASSDAASRHIPQDVRMAVWQRDQGKCVQCTATSYLEFDHIIPFSKGGANTVKNVQLLCRKCNLGKGNRI